MSRTESLTMSRTESLTISRAESLTMSKAVSVSGPVRNLKVCGHVNKVSQVPIKRRSSPAFCLPNTAMMTSNITLTLPVNDLINWLLINLIILL